eukprot:scaffold146222_cov44-Attheya_sp.AAC.3
MASPERAPRPITQVSTPGASEQGGVVLFVDGTESLGTGGLYKIRAIRKTALLFHVILIASRTQALLAWDETKRRFSWI